MQFTNPDSIKNAVKRYNLQRAAERDESKKERDTQKLSKLRFCKMRCNTNDVLGMVTSRDLDVETQMSLNTEDLAGLKPGACGTATGDNTDNDSDSIGNGDCSNSNGFRFNIDQKIEHSLLRMHGGADKPRQDTTLRRTKNKVIRRRKVKPSMNMKQLLFSQEDADSYCKKIEGLHREVCAELNVMRSAHLKHEGKSKQGRLTAGKGNKKKISNIAAAAGNINKPKNSYNPFEKQKKLPPQRKQPEKLALHAKAEKKLPPPPPDQDSIMKRLKQVLSVDQRMFAMPTSYMDYSQAQVQWTDIIPSPTLPEIAQPIEYAQGSVELFSDQAAQPQEAQAEDAYYADDSDLEQEYIDRPGYMRYVERLPYNMCAQDMSDAANNHQACFVDLDPHPQWISFKRSLKPMDYSSQRSDTDTSTLCDDKEQTQLQADQQQQEQYDLQQQQEQYALQHQQEQELRNDARRHLSRRQKPKPSLPLTPVPSGGRTVRSKPLTPRQGNRKPQDTQATKNNSRQPGGRDKQPTPSPVTSPPTTNDTAAPAAAVQNPAHMPVPRRRKPRPVVITQSLENLKYQKMLIYNRISMTQERIIGALDNLQCRLLQLQIPTNNHHDKMRRERNAFKFCVKFSRNFLFPLRGLIDDVRCTAVANYHSATSNEASQKVVCAFQLMYHAIGSYKRHLRFFLLNKVPQKLSALIEMIYTLTNVCLEKSILDRQDPVVECLQQRCTNFLRFIEDMQEERFQLAHEAFRHMQKRSHGGHGHGEGGTHERYDLKMFLNDLKLYEPVIVPKETGEKKRRNAEKQEQPRVRTPRKRKASNPAPIKEVNMEVTREVAELQRDLPEVPTHIECVQCGDCRLDGLSTETEDVDAGKQKEQLSNILALLQHPHCERRELHQQLLEAMEHVTKSQVREVLDPLVRSLGLIINKKVMETSGANEPYFPY